MCHGMITIGINNICHGSDTIKHYVKSKSLPKYL